LVEIDKHHLQPIFDANPEVIARLSEIIASRLLANRNAIDPLPGDQEKINSMEWQRF
jgi:hypothetical protein